MNNEAKLFVIGQNFLSVKFHIELEPNKPIIKRDKEL